MGIFLQKCFHVLSRRENPVSDHENNFSSSDLDREIGQDQLCINRDLRRCILDFGSCFLSGSFTEFLLRNKLAKDPAARSYNEFSLCSYCLNRATSLCEFSSPSCSRD